VGQKEKVKPGPPTHRAPGGVCQSLECCRGAAKAKMEVT
jgi:hypothetical protein